MLRPKSSIGVSRTGKKHRPSKMPEADPLYQLDPAAKLVRAIYGYERHIWESSQRSVSVKYVSPKEWDGRPGETIDGEYVPKAQLRKPVRSVWPRLVELCEQLEIRPHTYIAYHFDRAPMNLPPPEPPMLLGGTCVEMWQTGGHKIEDGLRTSLRLEVKEAETWHSYLKRAGKKSSDAWAGTILYDTLELSPLMRYCLASQMEEERFARFAAMYAARAVMQFERYREAYRKVWKSLLPKGFAKFADEHYENLVVVLNG